MEGFGAVFNWFLVFSAFSAGWVALGFMTRSLMRMPAGGDFFAEDFGIAPGECRSHEFAFFRGEWVTVRVAGDEGARLGFAVLDAGGEICSREIGPGDGSVTISVPKDDLYAVTVHNRGASGSNCHLVVITF